jgi:hypothetical protein
MEPVTYATLPTSSATAFYKNTYKNKSNASAKSANISSSMGEKTPSNEIASSTGVRTRQQTSTPQLEKARPL